MIAVFKFFFIAHEKGFKFHAKPQTGAYSCLFGPLSFVNFEVQSNSTIFWDLASIENVHAECPVQTSDQNLGLVPVGPACSKH